MLSVECHCRRLICRSIVLCVIIHIHTQLHIKHLGKLELQIQIGVYGKLRQRQYALVRGFLIYHGVAPIECAETEILLKTCAQHLHASSRLHGQALVIEIYHVLHILHTHIYIGGRVWNVEDSSESEPASLAEIILPHEMIGDKIIHQIRSCSVAEMTITLQPHSISQELYAGSYISVGLQLSGCGTDKANLHSTLIIEQCALPLGELGTDI